MTIDIHSHLYPAPYLERLKEERGIPRVDEVDGEDYFVIFPIEQRREGKGAPAGRPLGREYTDIGAKLAWMDAHAVTHTVLSLGNPWLDFLPPGEAPEVAQRMNDTFRALAAAHRTRISWYATLPAQDLEAAARELDRSAEAGARAIVLSTRPGGHRLDDRKLWPLYERLAHHGLPLLIHPHEVIGGSALEGYGHGFPLVFGFPFETTLAIARLVLSGALDEFPTLVVIAAHLGGTLPYLAGRLDAWARSSGGLAYRPSDLLRRLYYDVLVYDPAPLACGLRLVGPEHLLFGSDHPFAIADPVAVRQSIEEQGLPAEARAAIAHVNAQRLFRL